MACKNGDDGPRSMPLHRWRMSRRTALRRALEIGAAVPVVSILAACGGSTIVDYDPTTEAKSTTSTSSTSTSGGAQSTPQASQTTASSDGNSATSVTLDVAWDQVPDNLDPQTARGNRNWWVLSEIYDTLTYLPGSSLEPSPLLAESWEVSDDGLTYIFKIRQGVKFSTGNELDAEAVKFSMDRLQQLQLGPLYMTPAYDKTDVVDRYTVKMTLKYPYAAWLVILSNPAVLGIIDPAIVKEHGPDTEKTRNDYISTHTAGAGAYMLKDWQQGQRIVLTKNPHYWQGWDGPHVDEVILETVPEEATRLLRLERGDVDIATVTASALPNLEKRIKENNLPIIIQKTDDDGKPLLSLSTMWLNLNNKILPTSDINIRKALIHAFNYDLWIEKVLYGYGMRMEGMIPRGVLGHVDDYPSYPYDLDKAKAFLEQASPEARAAAEEGIPFKYQPGYVIQKEGALMWQQDLEKIGIKLILEEVDQATLSTLQTSSPGVPIIEARWNPDYPDPDNFINAASTGYWPPNGYGAAFAGDEKTDQLIEEGRKEQDPEKRKAIYRELELYFHEMAAILMIAEPSGVINRWNARSTAVEGLEYNPMIHPLYYNVYKS